MPNGGMELPLGAAKDLKRLPQLVAVAASVIGRLSDELGETCRVVSAFDLREEPPADGK
jgi:hypothetical protein